MADNKGFQPIKAEEVVELVNWELPQVAGAHVVGLQQKDPVEVTVVEEVIAAEKITVAELEEIREAARIEGLSAGLEEGRLKGIEQGKEQGIAQGRKQGYDEGFKQGEAEVQRLQGLLAKVLSEFQQPIQQQSDVLEKQLMGFVVSLAKSVVGSELATRQDLLAQSITKALANIPEPLGVVTARVHQDDLAYLESIPLASGVQLNCIADESIAQGSYQLEAENTLVEYDLEQHLNSVIEQFLANGEDHSADSDE